MILQIKSITRLAVPLIIGQLSRTVMTVIDTVIVGNIGVNHLAAITIGSSVWFPVFIFGFGTMQSIIPKIAQANAMSKDDEISALSCQAFILAFILSCLIIIAIISIQPLLPWLGISPEVETLCCQYLLALAAGAPGILMFFTFRNIAQAMNDTRSGMVIGLVGVVINIPLSYVLATGRLGLPELGVVGCGIAFSSVNWLCAIGYFVYLTKSKRFRSVNLFSFIGKRVFSVRELWSLFKIGVPISLTLFCEMMLLDATGLIIASSSPETVAAHGILLNITTLIYTVPYAIGNIVTVKVAHYLGAQFPEKSKSIARAGLVLWGGVSCILALILFMFGLSISRFYTTDQNTLNIISHMLIFCILLQCVDGLQTIVGSAVRGYEDNHAAFVITALCYWGIGLPCAFFLGHHLWHDTPNQLSGYWIGIISGFTCCAILLWYRFSIMTCRFRMAPSSVKVGL